MSAAGFIATSTSGWSPGVWMSDEEKLIWKPDTPGSEPAGARISAGKSGSVLMSLPKTAAVRVNWVPVSCIPSPESPAKRIVTRSSSWTSRLELGGLRGRHPPSGCLHPLVRPRREVEQLLGERLGQVLDDVRLADDADEAARRRRPAGRSGSDRSASGRSRRGSCRRGRGCAARSSSACSTGWLRSTRPPTIRPKMSRSVSTPSRRPAASQTKTESPVPVRWIARMHSASGVPGRTVTGWRRLSTRSRSSVSDGTRRATAASVMSLTRASVVARRSGDAGASDRRRAASGC